jgi:hypothetical protein
LIIYVSPQKGQWPGASGCPPRKPQETARVTVRVLDGFGARVSLSFYIRTGNPRLPNLIQLICQRSSRCVLKIETVWGVLLFVDRNVGHQDSLTKNTGIFHNRTPAFEKRRLHDRHTPAQELDLIRSFDQSEYAHVLREA